MGKIQSLDGIMEALKHDRDLIQTATYPEVHRPLCEQDPEFHFTPGNLEIYIRNDLFVALREEPAIISTHFFHPEEISRMLPYLPPAHSHLRKLAIHALVKPCDVIEARLSPQETYDTLHEFLDHYAASSKENNTNGFRIGFS